MKRLAQTMVLLVVAAVPAYALGGNPLVVTPEPATIGLVVTGAGVVGLTAWLRNRRK